MLSIYSYKLAITSQLDDDVTFVILYLCYDVTFVVITLVFSLQTGYWIWWYAFYYSYYNVKMLLLLFVLHYLLCILQINSVTSGIHETVKRYYLFCSYYFCVLCILQSWRCYSMYDSYYKVMMLRNDCLTSVFYVSFIYVLCILQDNDVTFVFHITKLLDGVMNLVL